MRAATLWVCVLTGLLVPGAVGAGTYRFEDAAGVVHYTNAPSDTRFRLVPGDPPPRPQGWPGIPASGLAAFTEQIRTAADRYHVDRRLVEAVVLVESGGNPRAVSVKGAQGLMQLMPQRSTELGVRNAFDALENLDGGVRHLRDLLQRFAGNVSLALAAYNAGESAVRMYQGIPPFPETQDYVRRVRLVYDGTGTLRGRPEVLSAPQQIYRQVGEDGSITFTNLPPHPNRTVRRGF